MPWKRREEEECKEGRVSPSRKERDLGDVWGEDMNIEGETESRKKLDEQKRKLQNEFRDVERLSLVSKEAQESITECLQHQLQEVDKRRHDPTPDEHQRVQKKSQKIQRLQDKRRNLQKENAAAQEEMRKIREENDRNEERFRQLSDNVDKNKMADAEMATTEPAGGRRKKRQHCVANR